MNTLSIIPSELVSIIADLLDLSSRFSLSRSKICTRYDVMLQKDFKQIDFTRIDVLQYNKVHIVFTSYQIVKDAITNGYTQLVKWMMPLNIIKNISDHDIIQELCTSAALIGSLDILQYLLQNKSWFEIMRSDIMSSAVMSGNLKMVEWLYENECQLNQLSCDYAAGIGRLDILKYLITNGCPWNGETCDQAAVHNHLEILKYLRTQFSGSWDENTYNAACEVGSLEILKYLQSTDDNRDNECLGELYENNVFCGWAASRGHLEVLKWLRENGCPWDEKTCAVAAGDNYLDILKYLHDNGCPWDERCYEYTWNYMDILRYLHENGCPWDERACSSAAYHGCMETLRYLHENGCPWDELACHNAAYRGHEEILRYLHENNCPWDEECYVKAANNKHYDIIKYLYQNGCPRTEMEKLCTFAACDNDIDFLKWLCDNGWICNGRAFVNAVSNNNMEMLLYLYDNKCPIDMGECLEISLNNDFTDILKWLNDHDDRSSDQKQWDEDSLLCD